jgi:hypothetical protein
MSGMRKPYPSVDWFDMAPSQTASLRVDSLTSPKATRTGHGQFAEQPSDP